MKYPYKKSTSIREDGPDIQCGIRTAEGSYIIKRQMYILKRKISS